MSAHRSWRVSSHLWALALCACTASDPGSTDARLGPGSFTKFQYAVDPAPRRDYYVYVPAALAAGNVPLVVYLHGCQQTANDAALGTLWNQKAEEQGFIVAYPEQRLTTPDNPDSAVDGNSGHCWNWFLPEHQMRDAGEPATIAGITRAVMAAYDIDPNRVYVAGISAGGAMAAVMGATYPELYAALGLSAAVAYQGDVSGAAAAQAMGARARVMPVIDFQGTADEVVVFPAGAGAAQQWLGTDDLVDDGSANGSVSHQPSSIENHGVDASMLANIGTIGDLCVTPPTDVPCIGAALGLNEYPYTVAHYVDSKGQPLLDFWIIHGLGHTYVGGSRNGNFTDPIGPSATTAAYDFFVAHPKSSP